MHPHWDSNETELCLKVLCRHGKKYFFTQKSLYLQGIPNDINEQDKSFLDCKHKHMMKSGAPPDKVLYRLLPIEFHGLSLFGSWSYQNLLR